MVVEGHGTCEIAERLFISIKTVEPAGDHGARLGIFDIPGLVVSPSALGWSPRDLNPGGSPGLAHDRFAWAISLRRSPSTRQPRWTGQLIFGEQKWVNFAERRGLAEA